MNFCQYKDAAGIPGTGVHSYRFAGLAAVDLFLTVIAAVLVAKLRGYSIVKSFGVLMLLSVVFHWLFCVPTTITSAIGLV